MRNTLQLTSFHIIMWFLPYYIDFRRKIFLTRKLNPIFLQRLIGAVILTKNSAFYVKDNIIRSFDTKGDYSYPPAGVRYVLKVATVTRQNFA